MMGKLFENRKVKAYRQKKKELAKYLNAYPEEHDQSQGQDIGVGAGLPNDFQTDQDQ